MNADKALALIVNAINTSWHELKHELQQTGYLKYTRDVGDITGSVFLEDGTVEFELKVSGPNDWIISTHAKKLKEV